MTAVLSAAPHGVSAGLIDRLLRAAEAAGTRPRVVDISADFRYTTAAAYERVYKHGHAAPARIPEFSCAVPEHAPDLATPHVAHPGCFATAVLLGKRAAALARARRAAIFVTGITGSTGSGRQPTPGTHHPQRHGDLYAYGALAHRHTPEIAALAAAASGVEAQFAFVPHSGPFARGIHVTVQAVARDPITTAELLQALAESYERSPFVHVAPEPPRVKDVVGSNFARLSGGRRRRNDRRDVRDRQPGQGRRRRAIQWMNRMLDIAETAGLMSPAAGLDLMEAVDANRNRNAHPDGRPIMRRSTRTFRSKWSAPRASIS